MSNMQLVQKILFDWGTRCFGASHMIGKPVRALRHVEEAVELAQCLDVDKGKLHKLIDIVYSRPVGNIAQEIGGSLVTLQMLGYSIGMDPERCMIEEMHRVLAKDPKHFRARNEEKLKLGLD